MFYDSLGLEHFSLALAYTDRLVHFDISENDLGPENFKVLQKIFEANIHLELINIADCKVNGEQIEQLCEHLMRNKYLKYFYLRNCKFQDRGAIAIG